MNILRPWRRGDKAQEEDRPHVLSPLDVLVDPTNYNRATRRWAGLRSRVAEQQAPSLPRYVRRHYAEHLITNPTTRRQRRHRARIMRAMKGAV